MENVMQKRLAAALAASGMSQAELARVSGIDRGSISLYLSGRYVPKSDKLLRLAAALNVTPEWLSGAETARTAETAVLFPVITGLDEGGNLLAGDEALPIPRSMLGGKSEKNFFVLAVCGLAMYPRLVEGDRILAERASAVPDGATAVLVQDGQILIRTLRGKLMIPANPEFPPRSMGEGARILGCAAALVRSL